MDELDAALDPSVDTSTEFAAEETAPFGSLALISAAAEKEAQDRAQNANLEDDDDGAEEVEEEEEEEEEKQAERKEEEEDGADRSGSDAEMPPSALDDRQLDDPPEEAADVEASSPDSVEEEFVEVDLADIRKDVQCPICLGIIRKTRTVMECLHRFCRECIDKSMRLGNNECPVCRTHCASRRSLRDDLNFDALIAALYTDVDKYEEEEFALREENERRNKQLQQSIAETLERQSDAITRRYTTAKATAAAIIRKAQSKFRNIDNQTKGRTQSYGADDEPYVEEYEQTIGPETTTRERRSKRRKRETTFQLEASDDEQADVQIGRSSRRSNEESRGETSSGNVGKLEGLATWARAGSRSTARSGNLNISNNRLIARATMLFDALSIASQMEKEIKFDVHLTLQPFNHDDKLPDLEKPYLCCPANVTVQHVCEFLASRLSIDPDEELELVLGQNDGQDLWMDGKKQKAGHDFGESIRGPEILQPQFTLGQIHDSLWYCHGNLVLMYRRRG